MQRGVLVQRVGQAQAVAVHVEVLALGHRAVAVARHGQGVEAHAQAVVAQVEGGRRLVTQAELGLAVQRLGGFHGVVVAHHHACGGDRAGGAGAVAVERGDAVVEGVALDLQPAHQRQAVAVGAVLGLEAALHLRVVVEQAVVVDAHGGRARGREAHGVGPEGGVVLVLVHHGQQVAALVQVVGVGQVQAREVHIKIAAEPAPTLQAPGVDQRLVDPGHAAFTVAEALGLLESQAEVAAGRERVLEVARQGLAVGAREEVVAILVAVAVLHMARQIIQRKARTHHGSSVTERTRIHLGLDPFLAGATLGGNDHRTCQRVLAIQVGGTALDDLDGLDVVDVDVDLARALEHRHAIDDDGHTGLLAHVALVLHAAQLDLDGLAIALQVGRDAADIAQDLDQVLGMLLLHLLAADGDGRHRIGGAGQKAVVNGRAGDGDGAQRIAGLCPARGSNATGQQTGQGNGGVTQHRAFSSWVISKRGAATHGWAMGSAGKPERAQGSAGRSTGRKGRERTVPAA